MTQWTLRERLAFSYPSYLHALEFVEQRGYQSVIPREDPDRASADIDYSRIPDVTVRFILLGSGLLILMYGHGRAAFAAGVYLATASMADSPVMTFAALPIWVQTSALVLASVGRLAAYGARFAFAIELLRPASRRIVLTMWLVFASILLTLLVLVAGRVGGLLTGIPPIPFSPSVLPIVQIIAQIYSLAVFAAAAILAPRSQSFVVRIILVATSITIVSYVVQQCFLSAGQAPASWMFWYFNAALLGVGIGYPWAIFARRIAGVDFMISRGVAYAISIGIIVIAINLLESLVERVASAWIAGFLLAYGIPVVLGLSLNWLQGRITLLLETLLDHDVLNAIEALKKLKSGFSFARDVVELANQVALNVAASMHTERVTVYRWGDGPFHAVVDQHSAASGTVAPVMTIPANDPALQSMGTAEPIELRETGSVLDEGLLFPLVVLGRVVGALHCGPRAHDRGYDRAERTILEDLARELAIALVWLDPTLNLRSRLIDDRNEMG